MPTFDERVINGCISIFIAGMFGHIILEKARIVMTAAAFIRMFMLQYCAALKWKKLIISSINLMKTFNKS